jgi:hypothetical protein
MMPTLNTTLRRVAWCNVWNAAYQSRDGNGSKVHLTTSEQATGKTLCGRIFPADKGYPASIGTCRACLRAMTVEQARQVPIRDLEWVPSVEEAG